MPVLASSECRSSRDIPPTVDISLLVVIVVLLATMVGMIVMGSEDVLPELRPQVSFGVDYHSDGVDNDANDAYINITHELDGLENGNRVFIVDDANNRIAWKDVRTSDETAGPADEYAHTGGAGSGSALKPICKANQHYQVVIEHEDGSSSILVDYEVLTEPTSKNATC